MLTKYHTLTDENKEYPRVLDHKKNVQVGIGIISNEEVYIIE